MASAPLATTRIIASEPADSSSTALPPKTALAKPAEPARQEEVAALQQAEIAKALAVEKAELAKVCLSLSVPPLLPLVPPLPINSFSHPFPVTSHANAACTRAGCQRTDVQAQARSAPDPSAN